MGIFSNTDFKKYSAPNTVVEEVTSTSKDETNVNKTE